MMLSPAFIAVEALKVDRRPQHLSLSSEVRELHQMMLNGVLTEVEFSEAKAKLLVVLSC